MRPGAEQRRPSGPPRAGSPRSGGAKQAEAQWASARLVAAGGGGAEQRRPSGPPRAGSPRSGSARQAEAVDGGAGVARWSPSDAAEWLLEPVATDDKYSRGVLGIATGSARYPGAAVLGVEAALHTGIGMCRYHGPEAPSRLVLARRPEAVLGDGRVQAWLVGSGMVAEDPECVARIARALGSGAPLVLDAAAVARASEASVPTIVTPHAGELAAVLGRPREDVLDDPVASALEGAKRLEAVVLLKGATTLVTDGERVVAVREGTPWLATAGTGDALGGVLGALVAGWAAKRDLDARALVALGATAAFVHARAGAIASEGGPFTVLDLCAALPRVVRELLAERRPSQSD